MEDKIKNVVDEVVEENNIVIKNIVLESVEKIMDMPAYQETTIAELIQYDPMDMIDPITQGLIFKDIEEVCQELGIILEENTDHIGGLMFYLPFHKK